jgi:iron complex outermembrane recepter protein
MRYVPQSMQVIIRLVLLAEFVVPLAGWAQAPTGKKGARGAAEIEEITVTAQRREESIQETPISVAALTSEVLQARGVRDVIDIGENVPNLRIGSGSSSTSSISFTMRGLVQALSDPAFSPKVGLYLDGVYLADPTANNLDLEDLERVEVLRGPQGTLYGRNTIAGTVNFITRKPTEERSVSVKQEVGNYETYNSRVTVNMPLVGKNGLFQSDALGTLSLRETVGYKTHEGYWRNALPPGAPAQPAPGGTADYNSLNRVYNWTALRWQPSKDVTVDYLLEYHRYRQTPPAVALTYVYPGSTPTRPTLPFYSLPYIQKNRPDVVPNNAVIQHDLALHQQRDDGRQILHALTAAWDLGEVGPLGSVQLKSISSYRSYLIQTDDDLDGTPTHIFDNNQEGDAQTWSEELQWNGTAPRFHYVFGAYYFGEYYMFSAQQSFFRSFTPYRNFGKTKSYAAYGQATWTPPILGDKLSLTVGLRDTQDQVHTDHMRGKAVYPTSSAPSLVISGGKAFGGLHGAGVPAIDPMGAISYQWTDDLMTYVSVSRGFAGGGFNSTASSRETFLTFKPETLWSFDAGFKSQWLNNRLRLNAAGFFSYYQDLQVSTFHASPTAGVLSIPANAERAEIWGTEFDGTAIPFRGLEATVSYSFLVPKYTEWNDIKFDAAGRPVFDSKGNPVLESVGNQRSFPFAPHHQGTVGLTYTAPPTTTGTFSANLNVYWQDKTTFIANNLTPGAQADEGWAYAVVNGRLAYTGIPLLHGSVDIAVFGRNLLDRKYRVRGVDFGSAIGIADNIYGEPRTFGLQLIYNWANS